MKKFYFYGAARDINDLSYLNEELTALIGTDIKVHAWEFHVNNISVLIPLEYNGGSYKKDEIPEVIAELILNRENIDPIPYTQSCNTVRGLDDIRAKYRSLSKKCGLKVSDFNFSVMPRFGILVTIIK